MYCRRCGKKLNDDASFCPYCGTQRIDTAFETNSTTSVIMPNDAECEATSTVECESGISSENKDVLNSNDITKSKQAVGTRKTAVKIGVVIALCVLVSSTVVLLSMPKIKINRAMNLVKSGEYDKAYEIFVQMGREDLIIDDKFERAKILLDEENYSQAFILLKEIGREDVYYDNEYGRAIDAIEAKQYEEAKSILIELDYKDSAERLKYVNYILDFSSAKVGDTIQFGEYEQDNDESNGKELIEWTVLNVDNDTFLLISKHALDCKQFDKNGYIEWKDSLLRSWLNESFYNEAFSEVEKELVGDYCTSKSENEPIYDKVFLLNRNEVKNYISNKRCVATKYAVDQGVMEVFGRCIWWLRSTGSYCADQVNYDGTINTYGSFAKNSTTYFAVRPVILVCLE